MNRCVDLKHIRLRDVSGEIEPLLWGWDDMAIHREASYCLYNKHTYSYDNRGVGFIPKTSFRLL